MAGECARHDSATTGVAREVRSSSQPTRHHAGGRFRLLRQLAEFGFAQLVCAQHEIRVVDEALHR